MAIYEWKGEEKSPAPGGIRTLDLSITRDQPQPSSFGNVNLSATIFPGVSISRHPQPDHIPRPLLLRLRQEDLRQPV